jgi:hypothetical protein
VSHPLDDLISLAERTYVRLEAEQLIEDCFTKADTTPFIKLLEELVVAGTDSIVVLREILSVIRSVKSTLNQEGIRIQQDLRKALSEFGVNLPQIPSIGKPNSLWQIYHGGLYEEIKDHTPWLNIEDHLLLEEICTEAAERVTQIVSRLVILNVLEESVLDWMNGMIYEMAHSSDLIPQLGKKSFHH